MWQFISVKETSMEGALKPNFSGLLESMIAKMDDGIGFVFVWCAKRWFFLRSLVKHIVSMHINESPQECQLCGKSFKNLFQNSFQITWHYSTILTRGHRNALMICIPGSICSFEPLPPAPGCLHCDLCEPTDGRVESSSGCESLNTEQFWEILSCFGNWI